MEAPRIVDTEDDHPSLGIVRNERIVKFSPPPPRSSFLTFLLLLAAAAARSINIFRSSRLVPILLPLSLRTRCARGFFHIAARREIKSTLMVFAISRHCERTLRKYGLERRVFQAFKRVAITWRFHGDYVWHNTNGSLFPNI